MIIVEKDQDPIGHIENVIPHWHLDIFHDAEPGQFDCYDNGHLVLTHDSEVYRFTVRFFPLEKVMESVDFGVMADIFPLVDEVKESIANDLMMCYTFVGDCIAGGFNSEFLPEPFELEANPLDWFFSVLSKAFESWMAEYTGSAE